MPSTDFWWLAPEEVGQYGHIELFHQEPYSDELSTDKDPCSCPMLKSDRRYLSESISHWKEKYEHKNVFRSFALYSSDGNGKEIIGPFLLDIDRILENAPGHVPDLTKALEDTRLLVKKYCSNLKDEDYRVLFTGHKGFHIEVRPSAISTSPHVDRRQCFERERTEINKSFGHDFVDKFHDHVRLHNSINHWIDYSGKETYSMSFEASVDGLFSLSAEDIFARAKDLASAVLHR